MTLTDTHCHLAQYADASRVLESAASAGVAMVVATESPDEYRRLRSRVGPRKGVTVGLGLHPAGSAIRNPAQLSRFFRMLPDAAWVSEIGLDFSRNSDTTDRRNQIRVLESIFEHSMIRTKVVSLHSRGAAKEVVSRLAGSGISAVLHWYSGTAAVLDEAAQAGCYFSVNPSMVASDKGAKLIAQMPRSRVLLETDGPYVRVSGHAAEPSDLKAVAISLARWWDISPDQCEEVLESNLATLTAGVAVVQ